MSTNKKWSILLRVFLALVVAGVGVAGGYYLWGRSPVPQAFFERPGSDEAFPVRDEILSLIKSLRWIPPSLLGGGKRRFAAGE